MILYNETKCRILEMWAGRLEARMNWIREGDTELGKEEDIYCRVELGAQ